jgi:tetratricopeptide (TPR) repeat protein
MYNKFQVRYLIASLFILGVVAVDTEAGWRHYGRFARGIASCASFYQSCSGAYSTCDMFSSDCNTSCSGCVNGRQLASDWSDDPSVWFDDGLYLYRTGRYYEAIGRLQYAADGDPTQAKYFYFLALAQKQVGLQEEALASVQMAADLERQAPIPSWGPMMERYQGHSRVWLEEARLSALSQPSSS